MPQLVITRFLGKVCYAIDYCENPRKSDGRLAVELIRIDLTDDEAALGLNELRRLNPWDREETAETAQPVSGAAQPAPPAASVASPTGQDADALYALPSALEAQAGKSATLLLVTTPVHGRSWVQDLMEGPDPDEPEALLFGEGWDATGETWATRPHD